MDLHVAPFAQPTRLIVDLLFKLYPLRQPLLSRCATEVLTALCGSSTGAAAGARLPAGTLAEVMGVVLDAGEQLWDRKDADAILSLTRLVETGFIR
jgi:ribosomal RNA-processing protein 12